MGGLENESRDGGVGSKGSRTGEREKGGPLKVVGGRIVNKKGTQSRDGRDHEKSCKIGKRGRKRSLQGQKLEKGKGKTSAQKGQGAAGKQREKEAQKKKSGGERKRFVATGKGGEGGDQQIWLALRSGKTRNITRMWKQKKKGGTTRYVQGFSERF